MKSIITRTKERKDNHVTIIVESDAEEFEEIRESIRRALRKCPGKPSYSITRVDFHQ